MFFNNATSDLLQQFSIVIEVFGFSLVLIEIYFPRLSQHIDFRLTSYWYSYGPQREPWSYPVLIKDVKTFLFVVFSWIGLVAIFYFPNDKTLSFAIFGLIGGILVFVFLLVRTIKKFWRKLPNFIVGLIQMIIIVTFFVPASIFYSTVFFLNFIGRGRSIGAFGLILSLIGLGCEIYQVLTLCQTSGCYVF